jgi:PAS domain S-box-containing protein
MKMIDRINQLLDVPSMDPDDARRRKLLNILLLGLGTVVFLGLLIATISIPLEMAGNPQEVRGVYVAGVGTLVGVVVIYLVNRYGPGWLASSMFLLLIAVAAVASDEPRQVAEGRSLMVFAIPIFMASILAASWASFIMAALSSLIVALIQWSLEDVPNYPGMFIFFMIALVSWLAASGLERALRDLRTLNRELDQRVQERTRELAESLSKTEAILDSTADGIIVFDGSGKATVANPSVTNLLAHCAEEIVGYDFETLMEGEVSPEDREMIGELLHGEEMERPSVKFAWGDKTISASVAPVHLEGGEDIGTVAVFRDFTLEAEIDRMKSTFVAIASHELRTPLNAILGYTEMLKEGVYGELSDRQEGAMERLMANTSHMLGLVNNLLDRARIEAGTLKLNMSPFSPTNLIDGVIGVMDVMAQNKGLELTSSVGADVPSALTGDWQRLHQILINFANNAIKFTEEGGIDVRIYMHDKDHWAMAVSDTGIGIPEHARDYIFEPFRQVDESATREYGGAGLGLSIVKQLVEMMGGWVELESEEGKGSTFTVILPLEVDVADRDNAQNPPQQASSL